jgi:excinuclease ABC subunit C
MTEAAFINYMVIVQGSIIHTHTITIRKKLDETDEEVMQFALIGLREKFNSHSREIMCSLCHFEFAPDIRITVPKSGDKKKLLDLSFQNAQYALQDYKRKKTLLA